MQIPQQYEKLRQYQEAFLQHIKLVEKVTTEKPNIKDSLKMMFLFYGTRIIESSDTLLTLSIHNKLNDSYAISRMILETATNICFIASKPQELIDKSLEYAYQKMYRDLDRNLNIGNLNINIKLDNVESVIKSDKLENSIKKFTNQSTGEEIRDWTGVDKKTITQKIEQITKEFGEHIGIAFAISLFVIYRYSSEVLHGTTFGAMFTLGLTELKDKRPIKQEEVKLFKEKELSNILYTLNLLLNALVRIYLIKYPNEDFEKERKEWSQYILEIANK
ncbi:DUF5677 domain-containing protein [Chishuiella sp.]|uniref:DUF5677 domain-containing protein n=1 Tax=Chishuiella sp. TaxID=1969467 RepID=UPI0028A5BBA7|nr:DUF5677 domain-containing protein [Chishuiella sp.]